MNSSSLNRTIPRPTDDRGFTLLEVLIVMAILVFISLGIYQATSQTFKLRDDLQTEGEFYNTIRTVMGIVDRDVAQMYSPLIMIQNGPQPAPSVTPPVGNLPNAGASTASSGQPTVNSAIGAELETGGTFWSPAIDTSGLRPSHFLGTDKKISFISASHVRMYKDKPESEFVKITYEFKRDEQPQPDINADDSSVLAKTENVDAFDNDDYKDRENAVIYPLLHGVTKFKFDYYNKRKDKWETSWDSEKSNNTYPDIIRVEIEVHGRSRLTFQGTYYFRPEMPLSGLNPST
ncbi:MAG: type II secretion system protein GspJ [Oligoflexia bacterium]|nr:type II secretion system protein GspJ [Oligoflexia bacterium]